LARYVGQSSEIEMRLPDGDALSGFAELFGAEHERNYGFRAPPDEPVELMGLSVIARGTPERPRLPDAIPPATATTPASRRAWFPDAGWIDTKVVDRAGLAGKQHKGPLIVQEYDATCLVPQGWSATLDAFGNIRISQA
jgi:N-methylhydantoinase A